jgi:hypothetical protein
LDVGTPFASPWKTKCFAQKIALLNYAEMV